MKNLKISVLALTMMSLVHCTNDVENDIQPDNAVIQQDIPSVVLTKLKDLGFDINQNPVIATDNGYIVEGDVLITKKRLEQIEDGKQNQFEALVSCDNVRNIKIKNSLGDVTAGKEFKRALDLWNDINGATVKLVEVTSNPDINVRAKRRSEDLGFASGIAEMPSNGKPGFEIILQLEAPLLDGTPKSSKQWSNVIAHEIGHTIGFAHTGKDVRTFEGTTLIAGTPDDDNQSIMLPGNTVRNFNFVLNTDKLSENDKKAVAILYSNSSAGLCQ